MSDIQPVGAQTPFDSIRQIDNHGNEYWSARDLAKLLGYASWQNFEGVIADAMTAARNSGNAPTAYFNDAIKISPGKERIRRLTDYHLTRYACYLIAQNADPSKDIVAKAQSYFAVKTQEREMEELGLLDDPKTALEEWKERAIRSYMAHGFSEAYARNRVDGILTRKAITGKWVVSGITEEEIPILTDRQHMGTFDITTEMHKGIKHFPIVKRGKKMKHVGDLRAAMTPMEQAVITFAENVTMALHDERGSYGFQEIARDVDDGSAIARDKRLDIEKLTGKPVVSERNMLTAKDGGMFGDLDAPKDDEGR